MYLEAKVLKEHLFLKLYFGEFGGKHLKRAFAFKVFFCEFGGKHLKQTFDLKVFFGFIRILKTTLEVLVLIIFCLNKRILDLK